MKKFGVILFGLSMALLMSCSKEKEEEIVDNGWPIVHSLNQELTGEFEGEWDCEGAFYSNGKIRVDDRYIVIDKLPSENIFNTMKVMVQLFYPNMENEVIESIGNIFYASSYEYPITDLYIRYELGDYSAPHGYYASASSIKNMWSSTETHISETIIIGPAEPNTISFAVKADGKFYRIDLISKDHDVDMEFFMKQQWDGTPAGLWIIQYWFSTYRVINLQTGQQFDINPVSDGHRLQQGKEDTLQLHFKASQRTDNSDGPFVVPYI